MRWCERAPYARAVRERSLLPVVLATALCVLLLAGVLAAPLLSGLLGSDEETASDPAPGPMSDTSLDEVETFGITDRSHTEDPVDYEQSPPAGGSHRPVWLECGVYDEPVQEEYVVHDLEHGTVWITYDPDEVDEEGIAALESALPDNGILSPYPGLDSPVVVTVWDTQLRVTGPDDAGLADFIRAYGNGETSPEPGTSCHGGIPDPRGADDGSQA